MPLKTIKLERFEFEIFGGISAKLGVALTGSQVVYGSESSPVKSEVIMPMSGLLLAP